MQNKYLSGVLTSGGVTGAFAPPTDNIFYHNS